MLSKISKRVKNKSQMTSFICDIRRHKTREETVLNADKPGALNYKFRLL